VAKPCPDVSGVFGAANSSRKLLQQ
jgi:hypothetical protein